MAGVAGLSLAVALLGLSVAVTPIADAAVAESSRPAAHADGGTLPDRIGAPARVLQMVTVTSPSRTSTTGTLRAWERPAGGAWRKVRGPLPIVLGYAGWVVADRRIQSTGTSPAGRFALPFAFGGHPDPGTTLRYHRVDGNDWWPYEPRDPATYNVYQFGKDRRSHWRADYSEHLAAYPVQYAYAIVVGFNLPSGIHYSLKRNQRVADHRSDTRRGGGIFLHVRATPTTAGCIAMTSANVQWLLRWLTPASHPQVVMGPYDYVLHL